MIDFDNAGLDDPPWRRRFTTASGEAGLFRFRLGYIESKALIRFRLGCIESKALSSSAMAIAIT